jgi:hypothetical protein
MVPLRNQAHNGGAFLSLGLLKNNERKPEINEQRCLLFIDAIYCRAAKTTLRAN